MSGYRKVNYYELCRLCASVDGTKINVFDDQGSQPKLISKIRECLPLKVAFTDPLPKSICTYCVEKLERYYEFRKSCISTASLLEKHFTYLKYNDSIREGTVYVKDVSAKPQDTIVESNYVSNKSKGFASAPQEVKEDGQEEMRLEKTQPNATVPIILEGLTNLVQGGAIHITVPPAKEGSEEVPSQESLQQFTLSSGNELLLQLGFNKEKDLYPLFRTEDVLNRSLLEVVRGEDSEEGGGECSQCGQEVGEEDRTDHALTCPGPPGEAEPPEEEDSPLKSRDPFNCDVCEKPFKRKEHLLQHRKLHTGERPFACGCCGKSFSRKEHLVRHSISHTGQKIYDCDICGKSFGRKDNVRKHRRTHCISSPYTCEKCGKNFFVKAYYLMHKSSGCGSGAVSYPYQCNICEDGFMSKSVLAAHKLRHKKDKKREEGAPKEKDEDRVALTIPQNLIYSGPVFTLSSPTHDSILDPYPRINGSHDITAS